MKDYLLHFLRSCDHASWQILIIKPTRCINFSNLFWNEILHVSNSSSVHHQGFFTVHSTMVYVIQGCWQLASRIRTELCSVLIPLGCHWTYFHETWYLKFFRNSALQIQDTLKSDKNNAFFTLRHIKMHYNTSLNSVNV